ncbi:MAG: GDP-L-fucose synthase [Bacteroidia bacterium]|nr:GDP-L-fucose synthase [Bacteroidia bacterium]
MEKSAKIYVAGHRGMVGSAIVRQLELAGFSNIMLRTHHELDLCNQAAVAEFFATERPDYVFLAAAKVGGIVANNSRRAEFIYDNLMIQSNVIHQAHLNGVKKLLFLGSSCIYPKMAPQPITEDALLTGLLEPTNEPYAIAKIAGIKLCEAYRVQYGDNFISAMPTNLYGPNDNYDLQGSHVLPAMIRKFWEAKEGSQPEVTLWGDGSPRREFLHVDDCAAACLHLMETYNEPGFVNIGTGIDVTIKQLAEAIQEAIGYAGKIVWDSSKPNGTPRKWLDVSRLHALGFHHTIDLAEGIQRTIQDFKANSQRYLNR